MPKCEATAGFLFGARDTLARAVMRCAPRFCVATADYDLFDDAEEELALRPWSNDRPLNTLSGGEQGDPLAGADPLILGKRSSKGGTLSVPWGRYGVRSDCQQRPPHGRAWDSFSRGRWVPSPGKTP